MKKKLAAVVALIGALLVGSVQAFEPFVVKDIRVEGIQRVEAGTIFSYLPVKVGERITQEQADEAVRKLFETGFSATCASRPTATCWWSSSMSGPPSASSSSSA